jgi:hypothetical protein
MIYAAITTAKEKDFIQLLEKSKELILLTSKNTPAPLQFEFQVFEKMSEAAKGTYFEGTIRQTNTHAFPDIIANKYFGVEVKMTQQNQWSSTGNSILESLREKDVERIYIFFGKFGGHFDIKFRLYQECLPEVSVTHSPRYKINMDLAIGASIFDKMGVDYDDLRIDPNSIQRIKNYYRAQLKEGEELWWIDQDGEDKSVSPIIKPFRNLESWNKENYIVESLVLFPEIFGNSNTKFERAAAYLIAEYNAVCPNVRDLFTAGGKVATKIGKKKILLPQLGNALYINAPSVLKKIKEIDGGKLAYYWRMPVAPKDRVDAWKKLVDQKFSLIFDGALASEIFKSGLL